MNSFLVVWSARLDSLLVLERQHACPAQKDSIRTRYARAPANSVHLVAGPGRKDQNQYRTVFQFVATELIAQLVLSPVLTAQEIPTVIPHQKMDSKNAWLVLLVCSLSNLVHRNRTSVAKSVPRATTATLDYHLVRHVQNITSNLCRDRRNASDARQARKLFQLVPPGRMIVKQSTVPRKRATTEDCVCPLTTGENVTAQPASLESSVKSMSMNVLQDLVIMEELVSTSHRATNAIVRKGSPAFSVKRRNLTVRRNLVPAKQCA